MARPGLNAAPLTSAALLESAEMKNDKVVAEWLLPKGSQYHDFFLSKDRSMRGWPLLDDERITTGPAPMCIRFQTMGKCREACRMAHVTAESMTVENRRRIGERLKRLTTVPERNVLLTVTRVADHSQRPTEHHHRDSENT
jgi:hypothetical protein